jgi:hypothetical protein
MASTTAAPRAGTQWNVGTSYTKAYVTPATYHDRPEIEPDIWDYPKVDLFTFMLYAGKLKRSGNVEFTHAEHDHRSHTHTQSGAASGTGAGAATTLTLTTGTGDHLATGTLSAPIQRQQGIAYTASGARRFYITAVDKTTANAHTVTMLPTDATVDLGTECAAGTKFVMFSSAAGDGTTLTDPTARLPVTQSNYIQTIKSSKKSDGRQAATETYWTDPKSGRNLYVNSLIADGEYEARQMIDATCLFGEKSASLTDPTDATKTVYFTGGLDWYANQQGYLEGYTAGAMQLSDIENVIKNLVYEKAPAKQLILPGIEANLDIDRIMKSLNDNTGIDWSKMGIGNAANRMLDFGIDGFRHGGFTFMKKKMDGLNEQGLSFGISASKFPATAYILPWGSTTDANGKAMDYVQLRFMENTQEGSRYMQFYTRGKEQTGVDALEFNHQCEMGFQVHMARQINILQRA